MSLQKPINFGVLVYQNEYTKYSSVNVGDYIQSLATLNIYKKIIEKFTNIKYEFKEFLDLVLNNTIKNFNFIFIKRDSMHDISQYKGHTNIITIMNGWWMWPYKDNGDISFIIPPNIKPIFVSFHIYNNKLLSNEHIQQFKKFEPIGCRDLKTLEKLKNKGVKSYFSGCLTLTIDFFQWNQGKEIYYVDLEPESKSKTLITKISHHIENIKNSYNLGMKIALQLLELYSKSNKVYTSRLHCYLPCIAMNVPVEMRSNTNDKNKWGCGLERFNGLLNLSNEPERVKDVKQNLNKNVENIIDLCFRMQSVEKLAVSNDIIENIIKDRLSYLRKEALINLKNNVLKTNNIEGDIIETGCGLGGSAICIAFYKKESKNFNIYDIFDMIPEPTDKDGADVHDRYRIIKEGKSKGIEGDIYYGYKDNLFEEVKKNFNSYYIKPENNNINFIKGLYKDTLFITRPVSFAHIDCDFYDPVMNSLNQIVPNLCINGILVIDDYYCWSGAKKAVDDYFQVIKSKYKFNKVAGRLNIIKIS